MLVSISNNWMALLARCTAIGTQFGIINVYGPQPNKKKRDTWKQIDHWFSSHAHTPWILGGDFNVMKNLLEKSGGYMQLNARIDYFNSFIDEQQLYKPPSINGLYTWKNKRKD